MLCHTAANIHAKPSPLLHILRPATPENTTTEAHFRTETAPEPWNKPVKFLHGTSPQFGPQRHTQLLITVMKPEFHIPGAFEVLDADNGVNSPCRREVKPVGKVTDAFGDAERASIATSELLGERFLGADIVALTKPEDVVTNSESESVCASRHSIASSPWQRI